MRTSMDSLSYPEPPEVEVAKDTERWLLSEAFNDRLPELASVRAQFERSWKDRFEEICPRRVLKTVPRISKRLHDLAVNYLVVHPAMAYSLSFGKVIVKGAYSTLAKARHANKPMLLRLRFGCDMAVELKRGPDPVNMLRWSHFRQWEPGNPLVRVLNYSIDDDEAWLDFFDERIVRQYLHGAASSIAEQRIYPSPGEYCDTCKVPACLVDAMEAFPIG